MLDKVTEIGKKLGIINPFEPHKDDFGENELRKRLEETNKKYAPKKVQVRLDLSPEEQKVYNIGKKRVPQLFTGEDE